MRLSFLLAAVVLLIVVVIALDALGISWLLRRIWPRARASSKPKQ